MSSAYTYEEKNTFKLSNNTFAELSDSDMVIQEIVKNAINTSKKKGEQSGCIVLSSSLLSSVSHYVNYERNNIAQNSDFKITLKRLFELKEKDPDLDEDEEDEVLVPSDYAFSESLELLFYLDEDLGQSFPRGFCSLESRGGINLIWKNYDFDKEVRVHIPFSHQLKQSLFYWKGDDGKLIENLSLDKTKICKLLIWLSTNQSINNI